MQQSAPAIIEITGHKFPVKYLSFPPHHVAVTMVSQDPYQYIHEQSPPEQIAIAASGKSEQEACDRLKSHVKKHIDLEVADVDPNGILGDCD